MMAQASNTSTELRLKAKVELEEEEVEELLWQSDGTVSVDWKSPAPPRMMEVLAGDCWKTAALCLLCWRVPQVCQLQEVASSLRQVEPIPSGSPHPAEEPPQTARPSATAPFLPVGMSGREHLSPVEGTNTSVERRSYIPPLERIAASHLTR